MPRVQCSRTLAGMLSHAVWSSSTLARSSSSAWQPPSAMPQSPHKQDCPYSTPCQTKGDNTSWPVSSVTCCQGWSFVRHGNSVSQQDKLILHSWKPPLWQCKGAPIWGTSQMNSSTVAPTTTIVTHKTRATSPGVQGRQGKKRPSCSTSSSTCLFYWIFSTCFIQKCVKGGKEG